MPDTTLLCNWCHARQAVVLYKHAGDVPHGTLNGPRCHSCTPNNEYVGPDWRTTVEMRPVQPGQITALDA